MVRKEAILRSPLRILDRWIRGGLGKGRLGVLVAPPGIGKSACLVQLGLDALLRERAVLHVAVGQTVDHVAARYDALFDDLAERVDLKDRAGVRHAIAHRRLIWSVTPDTFSARGPDEALAAFHRHFRSDPAVVLVDGFDWNAPSCRVAIETMKSAVARVGAELWMTARDRRNRELQRSPDSSALPRGCDDLVDVALFLAPYGPHARLTLVKGLEPTPVADVPLVLESGTLRLLIDDESAPTSDRDPRDFTVVMTASPGAEEEFGACAERFGVHEVNYTSSVGREAARTRGLVALGAEDLNLGDVSGAYVRAHLRRTFQDPEASQLVLQIIWHQVSTAGELFFVGAITPDKTAHGGTGWAVELARHWGKPVYVFDQQRNGWFRWDGHDWVPDAAPVITRERFAAGGTQSLSPEGRAAIRELFERSFGPFDIQP